MVIGFDGCVYCCCDRVIKRVVDSTRVGRCIGCRSCGLVVRVTGLSHCIVRVGIVRIIRCCLVIGVVVGNVGIAFDVTIHGGI